MTTAPELMLASTTDLPVNVAAATMTATGQWAVEEKLDGIRAAITVRGRDVRITNRSGVDISHRFPDVVAVTASLGLTAVLDGEIIVKGPDGKPDFAMAHRRDAQNTPRRARELARAMPATFVAFDLLSIDGIDVRGLPYQRRRHKLAALQLRGLEVNPSWLDGQAMWDFVLANQLEGVVLKRLDSPYQAGRSAAWVKVKAVRRISALVSGYDEGKGHRAATFGALHLVLIGHGGELVPIGSVGTGFSNADCIDIRGRFDRGEHPIIVEVEFLKVSPTGHLREPSFKAIRNDLDLLSCSISQLDDVAGNGAVPT